jgi:formate dehydrogenase (NADP+) alpha subunit
MTKEKTVTITIDNKEMTVRPNLTILQAARRNGVYIPSLCTLEHLPSYGACRLCMVEVDGLRGFPTSCTTPVDSGMVIRTDTAELRSLRQEILKLLLSEHPASCLFCSEQTECKEFQGTIRKVGVITGCRYCPNDDRCELQEITAKIGLTDTAYPVYYRGFRVEKEDPFYDRDYNLCILCGRCVRVCNNLRLNGTLSFKQRGKITTIGPAFDRTHSEAGCEFCGACVSACPTGALSAKVSKWYGKPEGQVSTTCGYCPVGCQISLQVKGGQVLEALADYGSPVDHGLICVKGRFAIPEHLHSPLRYAHPLHLSPVGYEQITWEAASAMAAERLSGLSSDEVLIMVSSDLSTEDLLAVRNFATGAVGTRQVFSDVAQDLGYDLPAFLDLVITSPPFDALDQADAILSIGFDSTFGYSPLGIGIKRAVQRGASLVTMGSAGSNLDMLSEAAFVMDSVLWPELLDVLFPSRKPNGVEKPSELTRAFAGEVARAKDAFSLSSRKVIVVGPELLRVPERRVLFERLLRARNSMSSKVMVLHPYTNLGGLLLAGLVPGVKPGEIVAKADNGGVLSIDVRTETIDLRRPRKVVYLIGTVPSGDIPECEFLIYQNGLPGRLIRQPDLILPSALFPESSGTLISGEGRVLPVRKAVEPFMESRPDWQILAQVATAMGKGKSQGLELTALQRGIRKYVKGFPDVKKPLEFVRIDSTGAPSPIRRDGSARSAGHQTASHRGVPLADVVKGMKTIENRDSTAGG